MLWTVLVPQHYVRLLHVVHNVSQLIDVSLLEVALHFQLLDSALELFVAELDLAYYSRPQVAFAVFQTQFPLPFPDDVSHPLLVALSGLYLPALLQNAQYLIVLLVYYKLQLSDDLVHLRDRILVGIVLVRKHAQDLHLQLVYRLAVVV